MTMEGSPKNLWTPGLSEEPSRKPQGSTQYVTQIASSENIWFPNSQRTFRSSLTSGKKNLWNILYCIFYFFFAVQISWGMKKVVLDEWECCWWPGCVPPPMLWNKWPLWLFEALCPLSLDQRALSNSSSEDCSCITRMLAHKYAFDMPSSGRYYWVCIWMRMKSMNRHCACIHIAYCMFMNVVFVIKQQWTPMIILWWP